MAAVPGFPQGLNMGPLLFSGTKRVEKARNDFRVQLTVLKFTYSLFFYPFVNTKKSGVGPLKLSDPTVNIGQNKTVISFSKQNCGFWPYS